jgi:cytidine deaminase
MIVPEKIQAAYELAVKNLDKSYCRYSKFTVGAGLVCEDGTIYFGCNIENASYGATVCAERTAIFKAVSEGHRSFSGIVVVTPTENVTPPCALCLQVMAEFCGADFPVYLANTEGIKELYTFTQLLSRPFGPAYLEDKN